MTSIIDINHYIKEFSDNSIIPINQSAYKSFPPISAGLFNFISSRYDLEITPGPDYDIIDFYGRGDNRYHALILAYLAILNKLPLSSVSHALSIIDKFGIFDIIKK